MSSRCLPVDTVKEDMIPLIHSGEHLAEFLAELGVTPRRAAQDIGVSANRVRAIVQGRRGVTADMGLRLAKYFGQSDNFWILLQAKYDKEKAVRQIAADLARITPHACVA